MAGRFQITTSVNFFNGTAEVEFHCDNNSTGEHEVFEVPVPSVTQEQGHDAAVAQAYELLVNRLTAIRTEANRWIQNHP